MTNTPAGWYPDPESTGQSRWWDGNAWTDQRSAPYAMATAADLKAPEGTEVNTVWIWLVVVLPLLPMIGLFTVDWTAFVDLGDTTGMSSLTAVTSPGYLFSMFSGWAVYGLSVWFAYLDYRTLGRRAVPRPFHWAWTFLSSLVYVIGRSVIVKRRTGHGMAPFWAAIASIVLSIAVSIYLVVTIFAAVAQQMSTLAEFSY